MNISEALIEDVLRIEQKALSDVDLRKAQNCLIDYLAVSFAGSRMIENKIISYASNFTSGDIRILGIDLKTDLLSSAFLHGMMSHVAELDDGHRYGMFHPGAPIFSAVFPLSQTVKASKDRFFKAIVCGYQISIKIAQLMQPILKMRGFHATGIAGTIGAGIAAGVLFEFNKEQLLNTLSACCTSASGILKVIKDGSDMKPLNVAYAAQNGISAAMSARAGFTGTDDVLGGKWGFIQSFVDQQNISSELIMDETLQIHNIYVKPYAACRHCHAPIEGVIRLKEEYNLVPESISGIDVETYFLAIGGHDHQEIRSVNSAKMSIPYSVAVSALHGRADIELFDDPFISDSTVSALTQKVRVKEDADYSARVPGQRAARVLIHTVDGKTYKKEVLLPKGEPENPVHDNELIDKFRSLLKYSGRNKKQSARLLDSIFQSDSEKLEGFIESLYNV